MEKEIILNHGLTMDEYDHIVEILGREPNLTEMGMFSVLWSEHCSYKSSKKYLKELYTSGKRIVQGPGENAGIIDIGDGIKVVMKVESHNHPSAVEPFQGAATGVGGIIRDILTMGARPVCLLNSLRFGSATRSRTDYLLEGVVKGISFYGNCVGVPTVGGETYFDPCYDGNILVNVMCVGILEKDVIVKGIAKGDGNPVIYTGSSTGKDGIKGASFASKELHEQSDEDKPSIQVGDPFTEKLLIEACLEIADKDYLVGMQDMGAAGLTSSSSEMADRGNSGIVIHLDKVPKRQKDMTAYDFMLSESQERMLLVVKKGYEDEAIRVFEKYDLNTSVIGEVTDDQHMKLYMNGNLEADIPVTSLTSTAPVYDRPFEKPKYFDELAKWDEHKIEEPKKLDDVFEKLIQSKNLEDKRYIYEQYDRSVQVNTVLSSGQCDASVLRIKGTNRAIAVTTDCNSKYCYLNPYKGSMIAVAEACRNVVCSGAEPIAVTDGLNFGNPENPEVYWQFVESVRGINEACKYFDTPIVGGNVSFYNEYNNIPIYPTPVIGMLGVIEDIKHITDIAFKDEGDVILLLGKHSKTITGSEYLKVVAGEVGNDVPLFDIDKEKYVQQLCLELIREGIVKSAHDISEGGLARSIFESCQAGKTGAIIELNTIDARSDAVLFGEDQSRIIVTCKMDDVENIIALSERNNVEIQVIGTVIKKRIIDFKSYFFYDFED